MTPGDKVKIKPYEDIIKDLDEHDVYKDSLFFDLERMRLYCGSTLELRSREDGTRNVWNVVGNSWYWHEDWMEFEFLKDEDFEI